LPEEYLNVDDNAFNELEAEAKDTKCG